MPAPRPSPAPPAGAAWISAMLASLMLAGMLAGCASGTKEDILPQEGPTMKEVYDRHFQIARPASTAPTLGGRPAGTDPGLEGYTRDAHNEIDSQFPRLPNPDLVVYVFPHMSDKGYPVPGYSTVIPLYETVEYALPGEKEGW